MSSLLKFLICTLTNVFVSRIGEETEFDSPEEDDSSPVEESDDSDEVEEESEEKEESDDDYEEPKISRRQSEIIKLRQARQEAEKKYEKAMEELATARRQPEPKREQSNEDSLRRQEDEILNNPDATDWQRYAVRSARDARQASANSQTALREARDINDKAQFSKIAQSSPKAFAKYEDKVENMLKSMRANGNDAPRTELYYYILGKDMAEGKLKTSSTKSDVKTGGVKRGSTPNARSDVSSRESGKLSDAEKRVKRLENVRI
jgi:hypothetical protein